MRLCRSCDRCGLGCVGVLMAGVTPFFKKNYQSSIHYTGGAIIALSWASWMTIMQQYIIIALCGIFIGICCIVKPKSWVLWFEVVGLFGLIFVCINISLHKRCIQILCRFPKFLPAFVIYKH